MSPATSAVVLAPAVAVALMALALQLSAAVAAAAPPIGLAGCDTTCGNVRVPYPFGISPGCHWPGLYLNCDRNHDPPRLLIGDGTLRVTNISLKDTTVRVMRTGPIINVTGDSISEGWTNASFGRGFTEYGYLLSSGNELVVLGCNVVAMLLADGVGVKAPGSIGGCASLCSKVYGSGDINSIDVYGPIAGQQCTGTSGCCQSSVPDANPPSRVQAKRLYSGSDTVDEMQAPVNVFVAETGWIQQLASLRWSTEKMAEKIEMGLEAAMSFPLVLRWAVKQGFTALPGNSSGQCAGDITSSICKSKDSFCRQENEGFTCHCNTGYQGNPYIADGCKDVDECSSNTTKRCFGVCHNLPGTFKCQCPLGTFGNPHKGNGCVSLSTILSTFIKKNKIGLSAASGPVLLLLVLGIMLVPRKIEEHRMKVLKQKYFKQNRGQLLQQLMSQKADIAERMIIPMEELAKATNNFDKTRELGGGGHGTVYKGILSDLHVVAIKKSKITVQKEIDEFINEVAILSQVNHKNIVKLFGCCLETEVPLLVYEFISNGTLCHHLHVEGPRSLSWGKRLRIATEIASSLAYIHTAVSIPIIHRDIKSSNILLDDKMTSKISDFGASRYIPIDKTGLTTRVQGTIGYLDPMYFQTGRLTEKSDVYSFGVILVELLTRKKPFSYLSTEGDGLVSHFLDLHAEGNLVQIMDPHVTEEGGEEVQEVAALAASCINFRGEERPTMRQVEHTLVGLWGSKKYKREDTVAAEFEDDSIVTNCPTSAKGGQSFKESSRRYSLEQEMMMSARYPR
ncbi:wall-associated receptor kinase 3-like [Miscanthus floridulus]|uniref:wall-associated receptor kinase 3-like n=1 Tax=Miscanthus floridulus TaxID=154761 RepID=UPI0034593DB4